MPFTEFCCRAGGNNLNAGALTGSSVEPTVTALASYSTGTWVNSTRVFSLTGGTFQPDGVQPNMFASIYLNGATTATYIGRISAVGPTSITINNSGVTAGTNPGDNTGSMNLKVGGAWQGPTGTIGFPFTLNLISLVDVNNRLFRINMKSDQTMSITAAISTAGNGGWASGYTSSYGDGGKAIWRGPTTGSAFNLFTNANLDWSFHDWDVAQNGNAGNSSLLVFSGSRGVVRRIIAHDCRGYGISADIMIVSECETYSCNQSNTGLGGITGNFPAAVISRCVSHDNTGVGISAFNIINCISYNNSSNGFNLTASNEENYIKGCTAYNNAGHGIRVSGTDSGVIIENNLLVNNGIYGISSGASTVPSLLYNNAFYNNTLGTITTNSFQTDVSGSITLSSNPFVDPANGNFNLNSTASLCRGAGIGTFGTGGLPNTISYPDVGAVQHQDPVLPNQSDVRSSVTYGYSSTGSLIVFGTASGYATVSKEVGGNSRGSTGTCVKLTPTSNINYGYWHFLIPVESTTTYSLNFYHKISSGFNGQLSVSVIDCDQSTTLISSQTVNLINDGYYRLFTSVPFTPSSVPGFCLARMEILGNVGSVYIDDIGI